MNAADQQFLFRALNQNQHAADFVVGLIGRMDAWNTGATGPDAVSVEMGLLMSPFLREHATRLQPVMSAAFMQWLAVRPLIAVDEPLPQPNEQIEDRNYVDGPLLRALRRPWLGVLLMCVALTNGPDTMPTRGEEVTRWFATGKV